MRPALPESANNWRIEYQGITMNIEQHFLIKYGLHNFVSWHRTSRQKVFRIKSMEGQDMIKDAKYLIKENFGETAEIRVI